MPTGKDSVQIAVIMPKDLKDKLLRFAKAKRWSLSQAGVVLIEEGLERFEVEDSTKKE